MDLIELHILQSFPVTCLNRDDVGAPKSAVFGGCQRARISSQCWKRAIREMAKNSEKELFGGQRTRYVIRELEELFTARAVPSDKVRTLAALTADGLGKLDSEEKGNVKTLLYFSPQELEKVADAMLQTDHADLLARAAAETGDDKKAAKDKEKAGKELLKLAEKAAKALASKVKDAADIAIFGRMVADDHSLMVEGAGLFSHALSTHSTANEIDFFSAVDDKNADDSGAGHIGTLEFNAACYYRYVGLNLDLLWDNGHLGHFADDERRAVVDAFLRAAIMAVPSARKNSMFGHNPPSFVLGLRRQGHPLSLANAFENPVRSSQGYSTESRERLLDHWDQLRNTYKLTHKAEPKLPDVDIDTFVASLLDGEL